MQRSTQIRDRSKRIIYYRKYFLLMLRNNNHEPQTCPPPKKKEGRVPFPAWTPNKTRKRPPPLHNRDKRKLESQTVLVIFHVRVFEERKSTPRSTELHVWQRGAGSVEKHILPAVGSPACGRRNVGCTQAGGTASGTFPRFSTVFASVPRHGPKGTRGRRRGRRRRRRGRRRGRRKKRKRKRKRKNHDSVLERSHYRVRRHVSKVIHRRVPRRSS
mmetsp:Transcript_5293/g.11825  ORF Transcript_5293/g.11825 Transcript_5293/m.11825 type:complete len:215 (+) Transcript_5293:6106-6750(+)